MTPEQLQTIAQVEKDLARVLEYIPGYMHDGIVHYIVLGDKPGDFLTAVFENNFNMVVRRADDANIKCLGIYVSLLSAIPVEAWGSKEKVEKWMEQGGFAGKEAEVKESLLPEKTCNRCGLVKRTASMMCPECGEMHQWR